MKSKWIMENSKWISKLYHLSILNFPLSILTSLTLERLGRNVFAAEKYGIYDVHSRAELI
jgi:hypothetical protein